MSTWPVTANLAPYLTDYHLTVYTHLTVSNGRVPELP